MKVLFLSRYQNSVERGAEIFVRELTKRLSVSHSIEIFAGKRADSMKDALAAKADIVIPINGRMQSLQVSLGRLLGGYKILITGHSGRGWDDIWNIAVAKPNLFVALTEEMTNWAKRWAWGNKVVKIPNGIDLEKFKPQGEKLNLQLPKPVILSVGALTWYKHHEKVIDAVSKIDKCSLLIIGEGPLKDELIKEAKEKLQGRFMISHFNNSDMPKVYRSCDLFTLPSWDREAFGIVYLEAMASGLGVVAPNDAARKEIVGNAGILTDVSSPIAYAEAIQKGLSINWSKKARDQAEKFSWDKIAEKYEKLMLSIMKK